jgi:hypothetical protein
MNSTEYVVNRSVRTGDRLTKSLEMAGYPRVFATEAEALEHYNAEPRAPREVHRMVRALGPGHAFKFLAQRRWR